MGTIYGIRNEVNHKWYIGKCSGDAEERKKRHFSGYGSQEVKEAIVECGVENFTFHIIHDGVIPELLNNYEITTIAKYNAVFPNGYNQTFGGDGCNASDETSRKISKAVSKTFAESPEIWREAQKRATEVAAKHNTGREYSESHRKNISKALTGKKLNRPAHNRSALWDNVDEVIRLYTEEKLSCMSIAAKYGVSSSAAHNLLKSNGVKLFRNRRSVRREIWNHQDEVVRLYTVEFKTMADIANIFDVTGGTVKRVLVSNKVEIRKTRPRRNPYYISAHKFFFSLSSDMPLREKRCLLHQQIADVHKGTLNKWVRRWLSEPN